MLRLYADCVQVVGFAPQTQQCKLCTNGLAAARRGADVDAVISGVKRSVKTCVWILLNVLIVEEYIFSNALFCNAESGSCCKSRSGVGGGNFSGRFRRLNEMGRRVSEWSHRSEITEP